MNADYRSGRSLEKFVAYIEGELAGPAFSVTTNERLFNENGRPIAEFDVVVRGRLGSGNIAWLIECRDREQKAGVDWIQQLPTRRRDHNFDKVTAVSTSGFTEGAIDCARRNNIELRTVNDVPPPDLLTWLRVPSVVFSSRTTGLHGVFIHLYEPTAETEDAAKAVVSAAKSDSAIFKHNDQLITCERLFLACVGQHGSLFEDMTPNGPDKRVELSVSFNPPTAVKLVTAAGDVNVAGGVFYGELRYHQSDAPLTEAKVYVDAKDERRISESAIFGGSGLGSAHAIIEAHTFAETGATQFVFRTAAAKPTDPPD